ncbi:MAG: DUF433 domain-containing protein [Geminicoccaceae bacterium]
MCCKTRRLQTEIAEVYPGRRTPPGERIVSDPDIMAGKPVIRGTRITVELLLDKLGRGLSVDELLAAYPI